MSSFRFTPPNQQQTELHCIADVKGQPLERSCKLAEQCELVDLDW